MTVVKELFTEKFRPQNLETLIAPERIKSQLNEGLIQNVLLHGSQGTGKTSTAFILAKNHSTKYINASSERGIDTIREDISKFCSGISLLDGAEQLKCIILDEIDNATNDFFMALRAVMEKYSNVARFVATCNHKPKIPAAILSRFHQIEFDPITKEEERYVIDEYKTRIGIILTKINITYDDETLEKFVLSSFPDMRDIMNKLQSLYLSKASALTKDNIYSFFDYEALFQLCMMKPTQPHNNYKFVTSQYGNRVDDALLAMGKDFPEYLRVKHPELEYKLPRVLIAVADYQYQKAFTIDPMITLLAAIFKIQSIIHEQ